MFPYVALFLAQLGLNGKQYSMKKCGAIALGPFNSICINTMRSDICLVVKPEPGCKTAIDYFHFFAKAIDNP